jgi:diguanylate cyclase (GGDEF)-like protein
MAEWKRRWHSLVGLLGRDAASPAAELPVVAESSAPAGEPAPTGEPTSAAGHAAAPGGAQQRELQLEEEVRALRRELLRIEAALDQERSQRARLEHEIADLAELDPLTGLARARRFNDRLAVAIAHAQRSKQRLAVAQLGLDGLARIEETLGPSHRDDLLRSVALALEGTLRQADTLGRLRQDDVFSLLLSGIKQDADVIVVAEKLRLALRNPFGIGGHELAVTASIGIALFPEDGPDAETLLESATVAMLRARARGGDAWDVHAPGSRAAAGRRQARESALRRALAREELELRWQPVVDCETGRIAGMHARLVVVGARSPGDAGPVTLAHEGALAVPLGQWALRATCRQGSRWLAAGHGGLVFSVDVSLRQLVHSAFVKLVRGVIEESGLCPEALELEVSEAELAYGAAPALERLADLRRLGIRIALDHFGTGESRLAHVHHYPLDTLKIDASVVKDAVGNRQQEAVIEAAVGIARSRRLRAVAEGVDSEAQRVLLVRCQCERMQGALPGPPTSAADAERLLTRQRREPPAGAYSRP